MDPDQTGMDPAHWMILKSNLATKNSPVECNSEHIEWFVDGEAYLLSYDLIGLLAHLTPPPSSSLQVVVLCVVYEAYTDYRGGEV
jgi:hypothetical protein